MARKRLSLRGVNEIIAEFGRLASRPSASRVASRHASGRAEVYITDMGRPLVTVGPKGEENIGRYGVWDGRGRRKPEVVATGDDLQKLQREYGPGLPVIRL